jgi:hypothetical protein
MEYIIEPDNDFIFEDLTLGFPNNISNGSFFTKIFWKNKPLFIQTPKCYTKQGFIKSNKKIYCDLLFDTNDILFITWLENLENKLTELLYEKSSIWFDNKIDKNDIESFFTSPVKLYKSGKYYLLKTNVKQNINIYNENNDNEIVLLENINSQSNIISILEIRGINFTQKNFIIEFEMKQCMLVSADPFLNTCYIKRPSLLLKTEIQNNLVGKMVSKKEKENDGLDNENKKDKKEENSSINYLEENKEMINIKKEDLSNNKNKIDDINFDDKEEVEKIEKIMEMLDNNKKKQNKGEEEQEEEIFNNDFLKENTFKDNEIKYEKLQEEEEIFNNDFLKENTFKDNEIKYEKFQEEEDATLYGVKKEKENNNKLRIKFDDSILENNEEEEKENNNKLRIKFDDSILEDNEEKENFIFTNKTKSNMLDNNSLFIDNNEDNNIKIDFEELEGNDKNKILKETDLNLFDSSLENEEIKKLKYNLYKEAKKRANELKKISLQAYMEAENIKKTYLLDNSDLSDFDDET